MPHESTPSVVCRPALFHAEQSNVNAKVGNQRRNAQDYPSTGLNGVACSADLTWVFHCAETRRSKARTRIELIARTVLHSEKEGIERKNTDWESVSSSKAERRATPSKKSAGNVKVDNSDCFCV
jgi:hypothetical protein